MATEEVELTEEEQYDAEYEKAWGEDDSNLEQPETEDESDADEPEETEVVEDSNEEVEEVEAAEDDTETKENDEDEFVDVLKWKGKEIKVTDAERRALAQKGFDSEKKWQEAAINRPIKAILDKYGFTEEQLEMFGNITKDKNAEALALLAQQNGIDLYEAEHKDYKPVVENRNYELDDVVAEINENEEIAAQMNDYVSSVPQSVRDRLTSEPNLLRGLNIDMKQGVAQKIMPEVIKQMAIDPRQDFVALYQEVGKQVFSREEAKTEAQSKPEPTREDKKRVAVNKKAPAPEKNVVDDYDAAWDDNTHFEAVRRRLQGF